MNFTQKRAELINSLRMLAYNEADMLIDHYNNNNDNKIHRHGFVVYENINLDIEKRIGQFYLSGNEMVIGFTEYDGAKVHKIYSPQGFEEKTIPFMFLEKVE